MIIIKKFGSLKERERDDGFIDGFDRSTNVDHEQITVGWSTNDQRERERDYSKKDLIHDLISDRYSILHIIKPKLET